MSSNINTFASVAAPQHSATETTAAKATAQAPNLHVAQEIQRNAEEEQAAANQAALKAKAFGSNPEISTDQTVAAHEAMLQAERTTLNAVQEGKHDVDQAKVAASGYVDTAKEYVNTAIETAQNYLPTAMGGKPTDPTTTTTTSRSLNTATSGPGIVDTVKGGAAAAYTSVVENAQPVAAAAYTSVVTNAQPVAAAVRSGAASAYTTAVETAQPAVDKVMSTAGNAFGTTGLQGKNVADRTHDTTLPSTTTASTDAASTAPLQSGDKVIKGPYAEGVPSHEIGTNAPLRN